MLYNLNFLLLQVMLTPIHFGLLALADQSGMKFSLWGYFWSIIWRILTDMDKLCIFVYVRTQAPGADEDILM